MRKRMSVKPINEKALVFKMPEEAAEAFVFFQEHGYSITEDDNLRVVLTKEWIERAIKSGVLKNEKTQNQQS